MFLGYSDQGDENTPKWRMKPDETMKHPDVTGRSELLTKSRVRLGFSSRHEDVLQQTSHSPTERFSNLVVENVTSPKVMENVSRGALQTKIWLNYNNSPESRCYHTASYGDDSPYIYICNIYIYIHT